MTGRLNTAQRVRERIEAQPCDENGCWVWQGSLSEGYGCCQIEGRRERVHRLAYLLFRGEIGRLCVLHTCDNRRCCNPEHLFLGTRADNMADMYAKGRESSREQRRTFGNRKLREADVPVIDALYLSGLSQQAIADKYGIHQTAISRVLRRVSWQHLEE